MARWINIPFGMEVGLSIGDFVTWGPTALPQKGSGAPNFWLLHCGWIKTALGTEVGIGPGHIVRDRDPAPLPKKWGGAPSPISGPFILWSNGWMHQDAT